MERVRAETVVNLLVFISVPSSARIFFGRGAVMAKALGTTPEAEHKMGLHKIAQVRRPFPFHNIYPDCSTPQYSK